MFGYVRADLTKLNEEDVQVYKAAYCSLCQALKQHFGVSARMLLNYDVTFLALMKLGMEPAEATPCARYCPYKAKKCAMLQSDDCFFECACILIILAYEKMRDNVLDESLSKRIFYRLLLFLFSRKYKKASEFYPELSYKIRQNMILQQQYEQNGASLDAYAHASADSLGLIFTADAENDDLYRFGYMLGRWIYFTDAADDRKADIKHGRFNALRSDKEVQKIDEILNHCIGEASESFQKIRLYRYRSLIENILYEGTFATQTRVREGESIESL